MNNPKIGIVILNYLTYELTVHCISKLMQMKRDDFFIIVVDNNSPNNSHEVLSNRYKDNPDSNVDVYYIESKTNGGYSSGNNIGIKMAKELGAQYVLIMNNDIEIIDEQFISSSINLMENDRRIGVVGPGVVEKNYLQLPAYLKRPKGYDYIFSNLFMPVNILLRKVRMGRHQSAKSAMKVYSVAGSCLMISVEHFHKINYYDENVFLYGEELILGEKMHKEKFDIYYLPEYKVDHKHSVTISGIYKEIERTKMMEKSIEYYFNNYRYDIPKLVTKMISRSYFFKTNIYLPIILWIKKNTK